MKTDFQPPNTNSEWLQNFFANLSDLPIEFDLPPRPMDVLKVARRCSLTAYDAAYLELALRTESTLATLDKKMIAAAKAEKIALLSSVDN